jgi:glycosyltransferase involved in cell wall biosynthesis
MVKEANHKKALKTVLFYASVKTKKMFSVQQFFRTDIQILRDLGYNVRLSNSFLDFLKFWKYNFTFIYFYKYGLLPAIISKITFKKVIFTGGIDSLDKEYEIRKLYLRQKLFFTLCTFFADRVILVSNSDKRNIQAFKMPLSMKKYPLSYHVIEFDKFCKDDIEGREKIVLTIAWMIAEDNVIRKGVDKSLLFFKQLHKLDPEYRMIIVGPQGVGVNLIKKIIQAEKLEQFVTLTGAISEDKKIELLKKSMIYTQLSIYEGFGIAAIEALAAGNIVVHTGKGGLADGISHYGVLCSSGLYDISAKEVLEITSDEKQWKCVVKSGVNHVYENFDYPQRLNKFREIISSLYSK